MHGQLTDGFMTGGLSQRTTCRQRTRPRLSAAVTLAALALIAWLPATAHAQDAYSQALEELGQPDPARSGPPDPPDPGSVAEALRPRDLPFDFGRVTNRLDDAVDVLDEMDELKESRWFGRDRQDARADMDGIIALALELLEVSDADTLRDQVRAHETAITQAHEAIADLRRKRVSAPTAEELSVMQRVTLTQTREDIDAAIVAKSTEIEVAERAIVETREQLIAELNTIGLRLTPQGAEALLGSITGDDYLTMAAVFENFRLMTLELERLVAESNEARDQSRRYYGMYTLLVRMLANMEASFIDRVRMEYIPRLEGLREEARGLIADAESGLRRTGGDPAIAETYRRNIESNRLTQQVAIDYIQLLESQAATVEQRHQHTERQLEAAMNTYRTVRVSSDTADLIGQGRSSFDALVNLRMPEMRQFENQRVRAEFERLTRELKTE